MMFTYKISFQLITETHIHTEELSLDLFHHSIYIVYCGMLLFYRYDGSIIYDNGDGIYLFFY